jgi:hypothetical protein
VSVDPGTSVDLHFTLDGDKVKTAIEQARIDALAAEAARQAAAESEEEEIPLTE